MNVLTWPSVQPCPRRKVPLRIGDVWILIGPKREVRIIALRPRPTEQKPDSQAVTLDDGRTLAESSLRGSYMRKEEYENVFLPQLRRKLRELFPERCKSAEVIPFPKAPAA